MNDRNYYQSLDEQFRPSDDATPIEVKVGENISKHIRWACGTSSIPSAVVAYDGVILRRNDGGLIYEPHANPSTEPLITISDGGNGWNAPGFTVGYLSNGEKLKFPCQPEVRS